MTNPLYDSRLAMLGRLGMYLYDPMSPINHLTLSGYGHCSQYVVTYNTPVLSVLALPVLALPVLVLVDGGKVRW